ncbi:hypothetical protein PHAVU_002G134600 [Phaseolus vulgaris]|uniref:Fungal lipase-type domain-containing protein n=1 Tax=Phaseolus vulgaris TaxID=3885 RepID=V7CLL0_PHAVU|nr:hypothetical protein PHAVU_002G134600g [Phaseolus vulgaris]ESW30218.1 hypothetical protein PHAVU_002G134600g [Phaseolus vulgaris]
MSVSNGNNGLRVERGKLVAPKTLREVIKILTEAITKLCETEKKYMFYLPIAIAHAVLDKGKKTIGSECRERSDCVELKDSQILKELHELKRMLTCAKFFSSCKRSLAFLFAAGFEKEDILYRKRTARILKPAFTVIRDRESKSLLVFIRGTRSIKDTFTDALCAPVSFDHVICIGHERHNIVSGHAHRGMIAAADWIRKRCIPVLLDAHHQYPDFKIKIVGHSLGGGTAALLTYKLREIQQFSSTTCVTFGPAACMTLELAEFGKPFITSIVNGSDIVPTLSACSVHDFIDIIVEGQTKDKHFRSSGSHLSFAKTIAKSCTEFVRKHKHSWSHRPLSNNLVEASGLSETSFEEQLLIEYDDDDEYNSSNEGSENDDSDDDNEDEDQLLTPVGELKQEKHVNIPNIYPSVSPFTTSARRRLYPPGRIMHMIPSDMPENSTSNHSEADENHVCLLYQTPTELYGKLRLSRGMIMDHPSTKYLKKLQQLIKKLEKE